MRPIEKGLLQKAKIPHLSRRAFCPKENTGHDDLVLLSKRTSCRIGARLHMSVGQTVSLPLLLADV